MSPLMGDPANAVATAPVALLIARQNMTVAPAGIAATRVTGIVVAVGTPIVQSPPEGPGAGSDP
jgi:hypothetical protein